MYKYINTKNNIIITKRYWNNIFLSLKKQLIGTSHECDYPISIKRIYKLTSDIINIKQSSYDIHNRVEEILNNSL